MIDMVDHMSLVLWGVFALAAGMYPLGFMLGGSCSKCCESDCEPVVEFDRCIRFVNTDTSSPRTTYAAGEAVDMPLHGYSRAVTRPEQVGAKRVPTQLEVSCGTHLDTNATAMSDGETRNSTYRLYYWSPVNASNMDVGTAFQWNVTLRGVTRPLVMPPAIPSLWFAIYGSVANSSVSPIDYGIGDTRLSSSAAVSVTVHSVHVESGAEWLDGAIVTEQSLKGMVSASRVARNSEWIAQLRFLPSPAAFQYMPEWSTVSLVYVIQHSRGATNRFKTFRVTVQKTGPSEVTAMPSGGLQAVAIPDRPYADTPYGVTPPEFSGTNATIYSDNAPWNTGWQSVLIPFPPVVINPAGVQLRSVELAVQATDGEFLSQSFANGYGRVTGKPLAYGWIMRAFDPGVGATFEGYGHPAENQWNYDTEAVLAFLSGNSTMPYNSGGTSDPTRPAYNAPPGTTWTMQVSDPTQFCGKPLCGSGTRGLMVNGVQRYYEYPGTLLKTLTFTPSAKLPQTIMTSGQAGPIPHANLCYGQDTLEPISLRLDRCVYNGDTNTCQSPSASYLGSTGAESRIAKNASARYFYCGDLLWVIENGPCRSSLTYTGTDWYACGTYELGGSDDSLWTGNWLCPEVNGKHRRTPKFPNGKCPPLEVEVEVNNNMKLGNGYGTYSDAWNQTGTISAGTYAILLVNESEQGSYYFPYGNCNYQSYRLQITSVSGWIPASTNSAWFGVYRTRDTWCSPWKAWTFDYYQGSFIFQIFFHPFRLNASGSSETFQPAIGEDFDVPSYTEIGTMLTSVAPQHSQAPQAGGVVTLQRCCPQRTEVLTIPASAERFPREIMLEASPSVASSAVVQITQGATAYITQAGYDGTACPFEIIWLSGSTAYSSYALPTAFPGRIFSSQTCPIVGQVTHTEQPGCEWSVTASENWIVASKSSDGLLQISIDGGVAAVFAQPVWYGDSQRLARRANITIESSGTTKSWTIIHLKP